MGQGVVCIGYDLLLLPAGCEWDWIVAPGRQDVPSSWSGGDKELGLALTLGVGAVPALVDTIEA